MGQAFQHSFRQLGDGSHGEALQFLPWFAVAHALAEPLGYPADGFFAALSSRNRLGEFDRGATWSLVFQEGVEGLFFRSGHGPGVDLPGIRFQLSGIRRHYGRDEHNWLFTQRFLAYFQHHTV